MTMRHSGVPDLWKSITPSLDRGDSPHGIFVLVDGLQGACLPSRGSLLNEVKDDFHRPKPDFSLGLPVVNIAECSLVDAFLVEIEGIAAAVKFGSALVGATMVHENLQIVISALDADEL